MQTFNLSGIFIEMNKLNRGIIWLVLSTSLTVWSYISENGWLQLSIFIGCIVIAISLVYDGYKEKGVEKRRKEYLANKN